MNRLRCPNAIPSYGTLFVYIKNSQTLTSLDIENLYIEREYRNWFINVLSKKRFTSLKLGYLSTSSKMPCKEIKRLQCVPGSKVLTRALSECQTLTDLQICTDGPDATGIDSIIKENPNIIRWNLSKGFPAIETNLSPIFEALSNTNHITHLNLSGCCTFETTNVLAKALQHNHSITDLDLSFIGIHRNSMKILCEGILANGRVVKLTLCGGAIPTAFKPLCNLIKTNKSITSLNLARNYMVKNVELICDALKQNGSLKELDLSNNDFAEKGGFAVAKYLQKNRVLTALNYSYNEMSTSVIQAFARAIRVNKSLKTLAFRGSTADATNYLKIAEASKSNSTLTLIDLSRECEGPMTDRVKLSMHSLNHQKEIDYQKCTFLMASDERLGRHSAAYTHFFAHKYFDRTTVHKIFDFIGHATYIKM